MAGSISTSGTRSAPLSMDASASALQEAMKSDCRTFRLRRTIESRVIELRRADLVGPIGNRLVIGAARPIHGPPERVTNPLQVDNRLTTCPTCRMTIGHPRPWPGYPRRAGLVSATMTLLDTPG